ncbi:MAG: glycosyltransferase family 2 protein [Flavobacterium sp.]|nr:glycosyltransferase family 2 protein [Flavobacterium sp.]
MNPFFSIIIPTYNSEKTVKRTLDSIFFQNFKDYEIIFVDGDSQDETLSIVNQFNDYRVKIYSEPDKGVYDAMNKGIAKSSGQWLYFIGSDDYLNAADVLQKVYNQLQKIKNHVLYGNVIIKGDAGWAKDGQIYNGKYTLQRLLRGNICHQSIFYRRSFLIENNLIYNLNYPIVADWDFNIQCRLKTSFTYLNIIVAVFNAGGISTGATNSDPFLNEIHQKYGNLFRTSHYPLFMQPFRSLYKRIKNKLINS